MVLATLLLMLEILNTYSFPTTGATINTMISVSTLRPVVEESITTPFEEEPKITLNWNSNVSLMYPPRYDSKLTVKYDKLLQIKS